MIIISLITALTIVTLLLINSLGLYSKLKAVIRKVIITDLFKFYDDNKSSLTINDNGITSLKLEAQKINEFSGEFDHWPKWKSRTECAFNGSGYDKILTDELFAKANPKMNAIVYSQLAVATVDGNCHHLIKRYEETRDGNKAWRALIEWYDGDVIRNETADTLRANLEALVLHPGISASDYVNKYMMRYQELDKIPGEGMSASHATSLFLKNIKDERYEITIKYLRNADAKLHECVTAIRKEERDQLRKRAEKRKLQSTLRRYRQEELEEERNRNRNDSQPSPSKRARRLTGEIDTTNNGCLTVPSDKWKTLTDDDKAFIQNYNSKIKHKESVAGIKIPDGVTIKAKVRRNRSPSSDDEEDEDDKGETSSSKKQKKGKKKVQFSLDPQEDDEE